MARPTKFTAELAETVLGHIREGHTRTAACGLSGISRRTLYNWEERGRAGDDPALTEFAENLEIAEAVALADWEKKLKVAFTPIRRRAIDRGDVRALLFYGERRFPRQWRGEHTLQISGRDGAPIEIDARTRLLDKLAGLAAGVAAADGAKEDSSEPDDR